ncbi:hypothetical protein BT93_L2408 [Corymbia citriodora subsp. variegata]|uniref:Uncharacterized protein n=1 Tax=Corymbia citriodora subsp. variegata TaxID=360336 RepID=A0A8T0CJN3_CORYI|nr:hypothetical protein BT93_L2408 [Corymbia citriodora subsp. variegata]
MEATSYFIYKPLQLQYGEFSWKHFTKTPSTQPIILLTKMYFTCSTVAWSTFSLLVILPIAMSVHSLELKPSVCWTCQYSPFPPPPTVFVREKNGLNAKI